MPQALNAFERAVLERARFHYQRRFQAELDRLLYTVPPPQGATMTTAEDLSRRGSTAGDLHEILDFTVNFHPVTRPDVQELMRLVRDQALGFAHTVVDIIPRSTERDCFVDGVASLVGDAIAALARYQDLIPAYDGETMVAEAPTMGCSPAQAPSPGRYIDPQIVLQLVKASYEGGMPVEQLIARYLEVERGLTTG